jgi:hypothetical protein
MSIRNILYLQFIIPDNHYPDIKLNYILYETEYYFLYHIINLLHDINKKN